jgi:uracil-DNA glycosylase
MICRKNFLKLPKDWNEILEEECSKSYFIDLKNKLFLEYRSKHICPSLENVFRAFEICKFENLKVVILGQDPYHNVGQAHGLSFSVPVDVSVPPSLRNIFKEIIDDLSIDKPEHGCLENWALQGVLLLNSFLSVELHKPLSHSKLGWEVFTDFVIEKISSLKENVVFLLWGNFAKDKSFLIDQKKHLILTAAHPSPMSSYKFFGCKHFSKTNEFLFRTRLQQIDWSL